MKVSELINILSHVKYNDEVEVVVAIKPPHATLGGKPYVVVKQAYQGIDWDIDKFIIIPEKNLHFNVRDESGY